MRLLFLDTCALVKRYVDEDGSDIMRDLMSHPKVQGGLFVCGHIEPELHGCFNRFWRKGRFLKRKELTEARRLFALHYDLLTVIPMGPEIVTAAVDILTRSHETDIGAADAYHLAALRHAQARLKPDEPIVLVTSDGSMLAAARRLSIPTFNPETEPITKVLT